MRRDKRWLQRDKLRLRRGKLPLHVRRLLSLPHLVETRICHRNGPNLDHSKAKKSYIDPNRPKIQLNAATSAPFVSSLRAPPSYRARNRAPGSTHTHTIGMSQLQQHGARSKKTRSTEHGARSEEQRGEARSEERGARSTLQRAGSKEQAAKQQGASVLTETTAVDVDCCCTIIIKLLTSASNALILSCFAVSSYLTFSFSIRRASSVRKGQRTSARATQNAQMVKTHAKTRERHAITTRERHTRTTRERHATKDMQRTTRKEPHADNTWRIHERHAENHTQRTRGEHVENARKARTGVC